MDGKNFDFLTRSVAQRLSRRLTFKALAAGITAAALGQADLEPAEAARCRAVGRSCRKPRGKPRPKCCAGSVCKRNRCQCPRGRQRCGRDCITRNQCCKNRDCGSNQQCKKNRCEAKTCTANGQCADGVCSCKPSSWPNIPSGTCQPDVYFNDFSKNLAGWFDFQNSNPSPPNEEVNVLSPPNDSIVLNNNTATVQPRNAFAPDFDLTAMSTLGGFSNVFPAGGYNVSLDIFLDLSTTTPFARFAYSSAVNKLDCSWAREFAFQAGTNAAGTAFCIAAPTGAVPGDQDVCAMVNSVDLTALGAAPGWYTFYHQFRNNGAGVLAAVMDVVHTSSGVKVFTHTQSYPADLIGTIGGNRFVWFAFNSFPGGVQIDNSRRRSV